MATFNPLPDYIESDGKYDYVEFLLDDESKKDSNWLKKVRYRVGAIVMEFNYLEREIDDYILEIMNDRYEDEKVWIFLETMVVAKKIEVLSKLYESYFLHLDFDDEIKKRKTKIFNSLNQARINRNLYLHANWLNEFNGEFVESKTKRLRNGEYGRIHKNISISDLENDLNLIVALQNELWEFNEDFFFNFQKIINNY